MKSFFFVPGNNKRFIEKVQTIQCDEIVLELEDGIPSGDIDIALDLLKNIEERNKYWVRPNINQKVNDKSVLEIILKLGFNKIILPKIKDFSEFEIIFKKYERLKSIKIILLVEHPKLLLDLEKIILNYNIYGLAFGLHDFSQEFGVKPNYELFLSYSKQIVLLAKAYNLIYIDTPSMMVSDSFVKEFKEEVLKMKELGCDGKFIIHPKQLDWFNDIDIYSEKEVLWAKSISSKTNIYSKDLDHKTLVIQGEIIEKPHINLVRKILEWDEKR